MTQEQAKETILLEALVALGLKPDKQKRYLDVTMERRQGIISIPPDMSFNEAIEWLTIKRDADEKTVAVMESIAGFPMDVAHSLFLTIDQVYGYKEAKDKMTFFGPQPPAFIAVPVDHKGRTVDVLTGNFRLPGIEGEFSTQPDDSKALLLQGKVKQKHLPAIKELAMRTRQTLTQRSLYKGKAIKIDPEVEVAGMVMPSFINTEAGYEDLLLNHEVISQVRATLWNPIKYQDRALAHGIPLKRGILLEGQYGTGKTLCANHTAQICERFGWTFLYCKRPEDLIYAYELARTWQPAVVFVEDVDRVAPQHVNTLSVTLDGVDTKNSQIILVMTTNHVNDVAPILIRPGRIDASIHFAPPDRQTAAKLVEFYAFDLRSHRSLLDHDIDMEAVTEAVAGNIPAVIREIVERAKLGGIEREPLTLSTDDIVTTAAQMKHHAELSAPRVKPPSNAEVLEKALAKAVLNGDETEANEETQAALGTIFSQIRNIRRDLLNKQPVDHTEQLTTIDGKVTKTAKALGVKI